MQLISRVGRQPVSPRPSTLGAMSVPVTVRLKLDAKRRPTIPSSVLDAAGVGPGEDLVARVEGPGRIVLESASSVLAQLQRAVAEGMAAVAAADSRDTAAAHLTLTADPVDGGAAGGPTDVADAADATNVAGASALEEVRADRAADLALELARYPTPDVGPDVSPEAGAGQGSEGSSTASGQR